MSLPGTESGETCHGPVPIGAVAALLRLQDAGLAIMPAGPARNPSSAPPPPLRRSTTVDGSGASTEVTDASWPATTDFWAVLPRSRFFLTAPEANGPPSWKRTPPRRVSVNDVPSGDSAQPVARPGVVVPSGVLPSRVSNTGMRNWVLDGEALVCGS